MLPLDSAHLLRADRHPARQQVGLRHALSHRPRRNGPLSVSDAYAALEQYAADYGREPLLLLMHAAVPETLRADLLNLIRVNFLADRGVTRVSKPTCCSRP
jgi:hypothetical protein